METLNKPWITVAMFLAFTALAYCSMQTHKEKGYTAQERQSLNNLLDHVLAPDMAATNAVKLKYLYEEN